MSLSRQQRRQAEREAAKAKELTAHIETIRTYPKDVVKAMEQQQKKEMRFYALVNRLWYPDDWDWAWLQ